MGNVETMSLRDVVTTPARRADHERRGWWDRTTLGGRVAEAAAREGAATAVVDLGGARTTTYARLDADANRVANLLVGLGVRPGEVVAAQLPNWYEAVAVAVGVLRAGAVLNPMLPIYRASEVGHMVRTAGTRVVFTPRTYRGFDHVGLVEAVRAGGAGIEAHLVVDDPDPAGWDPPWLDGVPDTPPGVDVDPAAVSELIFTSGTEARPKAIMHTEQTTNFSVRAARSSLGVTDADVVWMPSPVGHSTGFNFGVRMAAYHGLPLVLQDRWDPAVAADLVERFRCSYTLAATTFLTDLVAWASAHAADLSSLRLFGSGGAPVPPEAVVAAAEVGIQVLRLYGSTEVLVATWNRPDTPVERRVSTDGRPLDHVEVEVRDEAGHPVVGEPGEIFTRSPGACVGFFADPERTDATFQDGWVRSGDLAVMDEAGHLTVVGRKKEIIIRGGLNIAPREVEDALRALPAVADVAVVGLPDRRLGEVVCACVVPAPDHDPPTLDDLTAHLRGLGMALHKLPTRLELVADLPTTPTGKTKKHELVALVEGRASADPAQAPR